ncbi:uncharacterized protein [Nicotiana tomentosiformis]|uniref:uncharacterized protein n=1 Tax=Nicotiana tomentosiformis TaxID=4098 RepID=UPI00388CB2C3
MVEYEACIHGIRIEVDMNIKELLVIGDSDLLLHQVQGEWSTKNIKIFLYLHCVKELCKKLIKIEFRHVPRISNEFADALATLSSMIQHIDKNYIDPIEVEIRDQHAYCFHVNEEPNGKPWYHNIEKFLATQEYPENATNGQNEPSGAIDYFTKWVEASTYKAVMKKIVADFVRNIIDCRFGIPESIITDNAANLNSNLMREICEKFRIVHRNFTSYRPQMNGAVKAANKNIKRILRKIVEIPSLRVIQEEILDDAKWIRVRQEQLMLIGKKRMDAVYHGQLYRNKMAGAFNKRVKPRQFTSGQLVLEKISPHQEEAKGKFAPNWQGPYIVHRALSGGALILAEMDGRVSTKLST